jgi:NAD+ kinase
MTPPRVKVCGRHSAEILPRLSELGIVVDEMGPEVVISYGGDGTLLGAERDWPGVPKVALRDSERCEVCSHESNDAILRHLAEGTLRRTEFIKLRVEAAGRAFTCLNNAILHNAVIAAGVRYRVWIDEESYGRGDVIGDGLVVATPFGSSAYYRSITHSTFRVGIGLAFNNSIEPINHLVMSDTSIVRVTIVRGPAVVVGDQMPNHIALQHGDEVTIRRAPENAVILVYDRVRYPANQFIYFDHPGSAV